MTVKVARTLTWDETTPGEWKWLTFGQLCEIAEAGREVAIDRDTFVYFLPEGAVDGGNVRTDRVVIKNEEF